MSGYRELFTRGGMASGKTERSFIMVKPDGVQRGLVGEIVKRFEQRGFKLVAMKFLKVGVPSPVSPSLITPSSPSSPTSAADRGASESALFWAERQRVLCRPCEVHVVWPRVCYGNIWRPALCLLCMHASSLNRCGRAWVLWQPGERCLERQTL